jgi:hypothetical protein
MQQQQQGMQAFLVFCAHFTSSTTTVTQSCAPSLSLSCYSIVIDWLKPPTCTTNSPGSMIAVLFRPMNEKALAGRTIVSVTDLPAKIDTRAKPLSILTSGHTLAYTSDRYYMHNWRAHSANARYYHHQCCTPCRVVSSYHQDTLASFNLARVGDCDFDLQCLACFHDCRIDSQIRVLLSYQ